MQDTCILSLRRMCIRRETPTTLCTIVASSLFAWELATRLTYASSLWRSHFELGLSTEQKHNPLIPLSLQHECINSYGYNNYSLISLSIELFACGKSQFGFGLWWHSFTFSFWARACADALYRPLSYPPIEEYHHDNGTVSDVWVDESFGVVPDPLLWYGRFNV